MKYFLLLILGINLQIQSFSVISPDFKHNQTIPKKFTCCGANKAPRLHWSDQPINTKSFALICTDPDATDGSFVHWIMFNIPADNQEPTGGIEGPNGFDQSGYAGPCPPPGKPHRYIFTVYALDSKMNLAAGATEEQLRQAITGHVLASAQLIGLFAKGPNDICKGTCWK